MNTEKVTESTIDQRIEQMAKNLAVASIFAEHPQKDDDYDRIMNTEYPTGQFNLDSFYVCEDFLFDHADSILERLESEYDKLKGFSKEVLAIKRVWKLEYDWDGDSMCDVFIGTEAEAYEAFVGNINDILQYSAPLLTTNKADIELLNEAIGQHKHPFWETHSPFIYDASIYEVTA